MENQEQLISAVTDSEQPDPKENPAVSEKKAGETSNRSSNSAPLAGLLFWIVVLVAVVATYAVNKFTDTRMEQTAVLLDVPAVVGERIEATVLHDGIPVSNGTLQLVFENASSDNHLGSIFLDLGRSEAPQPGKPESPDTGVEGGESTSADLADQREIGASGESSTAGTPEATVSTGRFTGKVPSFLSALNDPPRFRVRATFIGVDGESTQISATTVLYVNTPSPPDSVSVAAATTIGVIMILSLLPLFTGTITKRKARLLFGVMYFITILSIVVPLLMAAMIAQSEYAMTEMERMPIGLVRGAIPGAEEQQWLVNIGGIVTHAPSAHNAEGNKREGPIEPLDEITEETTQGGLTLVEGGIVVPFFMVMLAMFGAAINMTRRVPEIQKDSAMQKLPDYGGFLALPMFGQRISYESIEVAESAARIRENLIKNFMYLLSAPFLAIAVYYLLRIASADINTPVLVIMGFATGLVSDRIVMAITKFAKDKLGKTPEEKATEEVKKGEQKRGDGGEVTPANDASSSDAVAPDPATSGEESSDAATPNASAHERGSEAGLDSANQSSSAGDRASA